MCLHLKERAARIFLLFKMLPKITNTCFIYNKIGMIYVKKSPLYHIISPTHLTITLQLNRGYIRVIYNTHNNHTYILRVE